MLGFRDPGKTRSCRVARDLLVGARMDRRAVARSREPGRLPSPAALPSRMESGLILWPPPADASPSDRASEVSDLVAAHARAIADGDPLTAHRIVRDLASIALGEPPASTATPLALVIGPGGAWFRWSGGRPVDLRRRRSSRLLLEVLFEQRLARPGKVVPASALVAGGWPGEAIRPESAMSRLYVAVLALRKLGLRDAILSQDGGYLLDPALDVTSARSAQPPAAEPTSSR